LVLSALAAAVRLPFVLAADFPLGGGGPFVVLIRLIQQHHGALPAFVNYNLHHVPLAVMAWVAANTPSGARFRVFAEPGPWASDTLRSMVRRAGASSRLRVAYRNSSAVVFRVVEPAAAATR